MAAKGGKARAEKYARLRANPGPEARKAIRDASPDLAEELLKAARGQPPFHKLEPKERLAAVIKALEWGLGRPAPSKATDEKKAESTGLAIVPGETS